jgi:hypothetical protein
MIGSILSFPAICESALLEGRDRPARAIYVNIEKRFRIRNSAERSRRSCFRVSFLWRWACLVLRKLACWAFMNRCMSGVAAHISARCACGVEEVPVGIDTMIVVDVVGLLLCASSMESLYSLT